MVVGSMAGRGVSNGAPPKISENAPFVANMAWGASRTAGTHACLPQHLASTIVGSAKPAVARSVEDDAAGRRLLVGRWLLLERECRQKHRHEHRQKRCSVQAWLDHFFSLTGSNLQFRVLRQVMPTDTPRILLVDDEESVQKLLSYPLRSDGYEVVAATDGQEALDRFDEGQFDLVMLDVMLPRVDGFDVCRKLRARSAVPISRSDAPNP